MAGFVFIQLSRLVIDAENVVGSFSKWFKKYELVQIIMGTKKGDSEY